MINKIQILKLILFTSVLISCSKDEGPPVTTYNNTLPSSPHAGQEFLFENLTWQYYNSGAGSPWWDEIYLITPDTPNLFNTAGSLNYNYDLKAEVFLNFDTSANWLEIKPDAQYIPNLSVQYLYIIYSPNLVINVWPLNFQLVGRKASIKVKFL